MSLPYVDCWTERTSSGFSAHRRRGPLVTSSRGGHWTLPLQTGTTGSGHLSTKVKLSCFKYIQLSTSNLLNVCTFNFISFYCWITFWQVKFNVNEIWLWNTNALSSQRFFTLPSQDQVILVKLNQRCHSHRLCSCRELLLYGALLVW